jgi:hypothetical protein
VLPVGDYEFYFLVDIIPERVLDPPFYYDFVQVHVVDYTATIAESRDAILSALEETGAASMSVALVDGEKVIWSEAFGVGDHLRHEAGGARLGKAG